MQQKFWLSAIILGMLATVFFWLDQRSPHEPIQVQKPSTPHKSEFSNFYQSLRFNADSDPSKQFVIKKSDTSGELTEDLLARSAQVDPLPPNWQGSKQDRPFTQGVKLGESMQKYAQQEGIELFWTLPRDYVVKHHFALQGNYREAIKETMQSIAADHSGNIRAYICPNARAAVMTDKSSNYLIDQCEALNQTPTLREIPAAN